jgi:hypothetical protein
VVPLELPVNVESVEKIEEFEGFLAPFAKELLLSLEKLSMYFSHRLADFEQAYLRQKAYVMRLYRKLEEEGDEELRDEIEKKIEEGEEKLREMREWLNLAREKVEAFHRLKQEVRHIGTQEIPKAKSWLREKIQALRNYLAVSLGIDMLTQMPTGFSGTSSTPSNGSVATSKSKGITSHHLFYKLPEGFQWVPLEEINLEEDESDIEYRKASKEEMRKRMERLPEVLEHLQVRYASPFIDNTLYFYNLDQAQGRNYVEGLQSTYEEFFGSEPVVLERSPLTGQKYTVKNGRHRILLAKEMGWVALPAKVIGK